jgi:hypothetical protein
MHALALRPSSTTRAREPSSDDISLHTTDLTAISLQKWLPNFKAVLFSYDTSTTTLINIAISIPLDYPDEYVMHAIATYGPRMCETDRTAARIVTKSFTKGTPRVESLTTAAVSRTYLITSLAILWRYIIGMQFTAPGHDTTATRDDFLAKVFFMIGMTRDKIMAQGQQLVLELQRTTGLPSTTTPYYIAYEWIIKKCPTRSQHGAKNTPSTSTSRWPRTRSRRGRASTS